MARSWQQLENLVNAARSPRDGDTFEVVIVGAGLAGLTAAYELRAHKPLVLEREPRTGGRILTRTQRGITYDLGAVFAADTRNLPFDFQMGELMIEPAQLGLYAFDKLHHGADLFECSQGLDLDPAEWARLARFAADKNADACELGRILAVVESFFQVIYPGEVCGYPPPVQHEAFQPFVPYHYKAGNHSLVAELERRSGLGPRLRLGAAVEQIVDEGARVRVTYREQDQLYSIYARTVILTVPAPLIRTLVTPLDDEIQQAVSLTGYKGGVVVALGVRGATLPEVGCIVTHTAPTSTIIIQHTDQPDTHLLLVYYAGAKRVNAEMGDTWVLEHTLETLHQIGLGDWKASELLFSDIQRWAHVGPEMNTYALRVWQKRNLRITPRLILGGELAALNDVDSIPYGMTAAIDGGRRAAAHAARILSEIERAHKFASRYLVDASIYRLANNQPQYVEHRSEGDIAFYGLILQVMHDEPLKNYLLGAAQDGLWEYQNGFGVTAEDSALVLEGLLECDTQTEILRTAAAKLVDQFYNAEQGTFETVRGGRARYWLGASIDATAHIGYLLWRIEPDMFSQEIRACAAFVATQQEPDSLWQGKWFPSRMITTFYAVRLLAQFDNQEAIARAQAAILATQTRNGDWNGSVIETSAALCALKASGAMSSAAIQAHERGRAWLAAKKSNEGWRGEPVLYYWYELEDGSRLFYHCADKGQVTTAWATRALSS